MFHRLSLGSALAALLLTAISAAPAAAGDYSKTFTFELDKWFELSSTDGPVTLHRLRLEKTGGGFTKLARMGGSSEYSAAIELQLEYTNESTDDWDADVVVEWLDAKGEAIDGFRTEINLDEEDRHELKKSTLTTLRYGLDQARKIRIEIRTNPE
jgi:hypothetical protein